MSGPRLHAVIGLVGEYPVLRPYSTSGVQSTEVTLQLNWLNTALRCEYLFLVMLSFVYSCTGIIMRWVNYKIKVTIKAAYYNVIEFNFYQNL